MINAMPRFGAQFRFISPAMIEPGSFDAHKLGESMKEMETEIKETSAALGHGEVQQNFTFGRDHKMIWQVPDGPADKIMKLYLKSKGIAFTKLPYNTDPNLIL